MNDDYTDNDRRADLAHHERCAARLRNELGLPDSRADLLAACKEAVQALAETSSNCHAFECSDDCIGCMAQAAHVGITAAIARAEGGAA